MSKWSGSLPASGRRWSSPTTPHTWISSFWGSLIRASFVAKTEVGGWPFFGLLAKLQQTVFVDRKVRNAGVHRDDIRSRLEAGDTLILFPEGTSSDGNRTLPFKTALFSVASLKVD